MTTRLWEVLDDIRANGWVQGAFEAPNGAACLVGAMNRVYYQQESNIYGESYVHDYRALADVIAEQYPLVAHQARRIKGNLLPYFNDARGRTQAEVETVIEKAAVKRDEVI